MNVSFDIDEGECLGLIGESGSGKSTIGSLIGNFLTGYEGSIHLMSNEKELADMSKKERHDLYRDIQVVFQNPWQSFPPNMCVGEGIAEGIRYYSRGLASDQKKLKEKVLETMHLVGLSASYYQKKCRELSGGECQRAAIGRAIIRSPRLLICDEVTSALDVSIQAQIINLLGDLQKQLGLTILFISHDLRVVRHITHRVAVMYLGSVMELGPTEEIFEQPFHPYTSVLTKAAPVMNPLNRSREYVIEGETPSPINMPSGCRFHPRCPYCTERCKTETPQLREVAPGRFVACHCPLGCAATKEED